MGGETTLTGVYKAGTFAFTLVTPDPMIAFTALLVIGVVLVVVAVVA